MKSLSEAVLENEQENVVSVKRGRPRKIVPMDNIEVAEECERIALVRQYAPECLESVSRNTSVKNPRNPEFWVRKSPEYKEFFGDSKVPVDHYKRLGYEPIIVDGRHIEHKGDPLYRLPFSKWQANQDKTSRRGMKMFTNARTAKTEQYGGGALTQIDDHA